MTDINFHWRLSGVYILPDLLIVFHTDIFNHEYSSTIFLIQKTVQTPPHKCFYCNFKQLYKKSSQRRRRRGYYHQRHHIGQTQVPGVVPIMFRGMSGGFTKGGFTTDDRPRRQKRPIEVGYPHLKKS